MFRYDVEWHFLERHFLSLPKEKDCLTHAINRMDVGGKKRGSKKQKLHHWKCRDVQAIVTDKAHRLGIRMSRICAWGTFALAYDGSGKVV